MHWISVVISTWSFLILLGSLWLLARLRGPQPDSPPLSPTGADSSGQTCSEENPCWEYSTLPTSSGSETPNSESPATVTGGRYLYISPADGQSPCPRS